VGEHHCNICTIISGGVVVGVGLDLMDHMSYLSLGCAGSYDGKFSGTRSEARCEAETSFSSVAFTVLLGAGGIPSFWSRSPECQNRSGCVPSSMYAPLSPHCNPCHRGTRGACSD